MYNIIIKTSEDITAQKLQQSVYQTLHILSTVTSISQTKIVSPHNYLMATTVRGANMQPNTYVNYMYRLLDFANNHLLLLATLNQDASVIFKSDLINEIIEGIKSQVILVMTAIQTV